MRDLCYNVLTEFYTPVVTSQTLGLTSLLPFSIVWFACNLVNKARGWWRMSSRAKEKVVSAFNRIFKSSDRLEKEAGGSGGGVQGGSPSRRLLRHAGYHVTPSEAQHELQPGSSRPTNQAFFKKKSTKEGANGLDPSYQKSVRSRRLMRELQEIEKNQRKHDSPPFTVELINDNLFDWHVRLYGIDEESELAADMREYGIKCISLQLSFPENFPFVPPFMRVVTPRIEKGFVMEGGAICMELLTPRGWASAYTVEAIVMQFAASIVKGQGRISKKMKNSSKDFNRQSAEESFRSLVKTHEKYGWVTPPLADG